RPATTPANCPQCATLPSFAASGYASSRTPNAINYFFSDRGEFRFDDLTSTDLAINWTLPIRRLQLFAQGEVINVLDESAQVNGNTAVQTHKANTACQFPGVPAGCETTRARFNPFTQTPVLGTHYTLVGFGEARGAGDYQTPRTYRVSLGLRF